VPAAPIRRRHGRTADQKTLVVCSRLNNYCIRTRADLKPIGGVSSAAKAAAW